MTIGDFTFRSAGCTLNQVLYLFEASDKVIRQCLIPHRKAREENWMYVLERGPKWEEAKSSP